MNSPSNTSPEVRVLMLGGTADARHWAKRAFDAGLFAEQVTENKVVSGSVRAELIYSVAGLVRTPDLPCEVISGGFTQFGGLSKFIRDHKIGLILDATHPFAEKMSTQAIASAEECDIPCWRFRRAAWEQTNEDKWFRFHDWSSLCSAIQSYQTPLVTVGQLEQDEFDLMVNALGGEHAFVNDRSADGKSANDKISKTCVLRTAAEPRIELPDWVTWLKAIGPFKLEDELAVLSDHKIDVLISKNSGGVSTQAKIDAARAMQIPVLMLDRPELPKAHKELSSLDDALSELSAWLGAQGCAGSQATNRDSKVFNV